MDISNLVIWIVIGLVAGWLASKMVKGKGSGTGGDILVGLLGSVAGGGLFSLFGLGSENIIGSVIISTVGAVVLLVIARAVT